MVLYLIRRTNNYLLPPTVIPRQFGGGNNEVAYDGHMRADVCDIIIGSRYGDVGHDLSKGVVMVVMAENWV